MFVGKLYCQWIFYQYSNESVEKMYNKREAGSDGVKIFGTRGKKQMTNSDIFVAWEGKCNTSECWVFT